MTSLLIPARYSSWLAAFLNTSLSMSEPVLIAEFQPLHCESANSSIFRCSLLNLSPFHTSKISSSILEISLSAIDLSFFRSLLPSLPSGANWTQSGFRSRRDRPARLFGRFAGGESRFVFRKVLGFLCLFEDEGWAFLTAFFKTAWCWGKTGAGEGSLLRLMKRN